MTRIKIGSRWIGENDPTYFVADIAANHDGNLEFAKELIGLAAEAGADAVKFQNFRAPGIVSDHGFKNLRGQMSHQAKWKKSVFEVYQEASLPWEWTSRLKDFCDRVGIDYFSTPYDFEAVDMLDEFVDMYKVGSGDITWPEMLERVAAKNKPVMLATGASDIGDVQRAVHCLLAVNPDLVLMQCNTNYTGNLDNFRHVHLNALKTFAVMFPEVILGLSDHTPGHATVLGAVALGARVVEKHFTDDVTRQGPDHHFSMTPATWRDMVDRVRELEYALGDGDKRVADNEQDTVIIQRRCVRTASAIKAGTVLSRQDLDVLRPAPKDAVLPYDIGKVVGMRLGVDAQAGEALQWDMLIPG
jgi:sialic acid synthase SpsE